MQDEINEKVIALSIRGTKITARILQKAIKAILAEVEKGLKKKQQTIPHGKQTLKQLMRQNAGVSNIEITGDNIKAFEHTAKKYGIDFALKKADGNYLVFFKGRDADVLMSAFKEFSAKKLTQEQKFKAQTAICDDVEAAQQKNAERAKVKNKDRRIER